eukprot:COSAG06_NODE_4758_length_3977_cov_14.180763_3_plen_135_part_00
MRTTRWHQDRRGVVGVEDREDEIVTLQLDTRGESTNCEALIGVCYIASRTTIQASGGPGDWEAFATALVSVAKGDRTHRKSASKTSEPSRMQLALRTLLSSPFAHRCHVGQTGRRARLRRRQQQQPLRDEWPSA